MTRSAKIIPLFPEAPVPRDQTLDEGMRLYLTGLVEAAIGMPDSILIVALGQAATADEREEIIRQLEVNACRR